MESILKVDIKELAREYRDYVISLRRHFHQYPELSLEEFDTSKNKRRIRKNGDRICKCWRDWCYS